MSIRTYDSRQPISNNPMILLLLFIIIFLSKANYFLFHYPGNCFYMNVEAKDPLKVRTHLSKSILFLSRALLRFNIVNNRAERNYFLNILKQLNHSVPNIYTLTVFKQLSKSG